MNCYSMTSGKTSAPIALAMAEQLIQWACASTGKDAEAEIQALKNGQPITIHIYGREAILQRS